MSHVINIALVEFYYSFLFNTLSFVAMETIVQGIMQFLENYHENTN
jgi:hypothetical protein